ncbi:MAG: Ig-like domain-containing protein [Chloroflexi bacterium]|nr:Ig-like domain-containing protein [Chloroflexota bacterium]
MKRVCLLSGLIVILLFAAGCSLFERATPTPAPLNPLETAVARTLTAIAPPTSARTPAVTSAPSTPVASRVPTESIVPLAFFESPQANAQFAPGETVNVGVTALDNAGIARVEFYADNQLVQSAKPQLPAPTVRVMFAWKSTAVGNHILAAIAYDTSNQPSAPATLTISIQAGAPTPVVQILAPASPQTLQAGVQLPIRVVADAPQGITQVQMYVDDQPYSQTGVEKAHAPFPATFVFVSRTPGIHTLSFRAADGQQRVGVSNPLSVNVVDSHTPVVNVSYSAGAILRGANLALTILAADTSGIASVQVWADNAVYDTYIVPNPRLQTSITLQRHWTSNVVGNHTLFVRVTDALNQTVTSPATTIIVLAPNQPTPTFTRVPPTFTPRPPTKTPLPQPGPSIQVISPMLGCSVELPDALHVTIQFNSAVGLRQLTTFAQYEGVMAQVIDVVDANGRSEYVLNRDWVPTASGVVEIFATAVDGNGQRAESVHTSCAVHSPVPPTDVPPTDVPPTALPSAPSASIISPALGCRIEQNDSLHVLAEFQGDAGLSSVQVFAQYSGVMAQPIFTDDAGGQYTYRAEFDWQAAGQGTVEIFATVQDLAGQRATSLRAACEIEEPAPPTIAPMPTDEPPPTYAPPPTEEPPPTFAPPPTDEPPPTFAPEPTDEPIQPTDEPPPGT